MSNVEKAVEVFKEGLSCSQAVLGAYCERPVRRSFSEGGSEAISDVKMVFMSDRCEIATALRASQ